MLYQECSCVALFIYFQNHKRPSVSQSVAVSPFHCLQFRSYVVETWNVSFGCTNEFKVAQGPPFRTSVTSEVIPTRKPEVAANMTGLLRCTGTWPEVTWYVPCVLCCDRKVTWNRPEMTGRRGFASHWYVSVASILKYWMIPGHTGPAGGYKIGCRRW